MKTINKHVHLKLIWTMTCIFLSGQLVQAQNEPPSLDINAHFFSPKNIGLSAPQVSDFVKYGNLGINYYNGLLDMDIALPGYKDKDFDLSMSIKYVSSGFIPSKRPSLVGLNWFLNFGGVISRKVNGSPDDVKGCYTKHDKNTYLKDGLWATIQSMKFDYYSASDLMHFNVDRNNAGTSNPYCKGDIKYDLEPDIFTFNFGKHKGSFLIDNQGNIKLLSGDDRYKIDLGGLAVQEYSTTEAPKPSFIKITAPDGFVYEFGGDVSYLEYFIPNNPEGITVRPRYITSWQLKSIVAPNQRRIDFEYVSVLQPNRYNYFTYFHSDIETNSMCITDPSKSTISRKGVGESKRYEMIDDIHIPIISQVNVDGNMAIKFLVSDRFRFYGDSDALSKCLIGIKYYHYDTEIRSVTFSYLDKKGYFFLQSLSDSEQGKHTFDYYMPDVLPNPLTFSTDHWGFWKGGDITQMNDSQLGSYCYNIEANRAVDTAYFNTALLQKVVYPTGGYSEIKYEPNVYNVYHRRDSLNFNHLSFKTGTKGIHAGGARVRSITNKDLSSILSVSTRTFEYRKPGSAVGSGILLLKPKYKIYDTRSWEEEGTPLFDGEKWYYFHLRNFSQNSLVCANNYGFNIETDEYFIGYSDVIERTGTGGYTHYHYSSWDDTPDKTDVTKNIIYKNNTSITDYLLCEKTQMYILNDMSRFRGKLLSKALYSSSDNKIEETIYEYNIENACSKYNVSMTSTEYGNTTYKIYMSSCLPVKESSIDSLGIRRAKFFSYNQQNQLVRLYELGSDSVYYGQINTYVTDFPSTSLSAIHKKLKNKNMISFPVSIIKTVRRGDLSTDLAIDALLSEFQEFNGVPLVAAIKRLETETPLEPNSQEFNAAMKVQEKYHNYDKFFNPIYLTQKGEKNVVYLWYDYGRYPIAEIQNATYDEVKAALGGIPPEAFSLQNSVSEVLLDGLRTNVNLKNAHITTYKYKPGVGIERITDPQGISTYYDYDSSNRLKEIYLIENGVKKIIESYEYNLVHQ